MDSEVRADTRLFREVMRSLLNDGISVRFRARGRSMFPAIRDGETVQVDPGGTDGDVALIETADGIRVHRVNPNGTTRGDCCLETDGAGAVLGRVVKAEEGTVRAISRLSPGMRVRRWIARWRGHF